jgi:hypothetical protein
MKATSVRSVPSSRKSGPLKRNYNTQCNLLVCKDQAQLGDGARRIAANIAKPIKTISRPIAAWNERGLTIPILARSEDNQTGTNRNTRLRLTACLAVAGKGGTRSLGTCGNA